MTQNWQIFMLSGRMSITNRICSFSLCVVHPSTHSPNVNKNGYDGMREREKEKQLIVNYFCSSIICERDEEQ